MRYQVAVISEWRTVTGLRQIRVMTDYEGMADMTDVGETPESEVIPDENIALVEVICDASVFATMQNDANMLIVWYEEFEPDA